MLLRYTSNIKVEEGMEKRATRANSSRNDGGKKTEGGEGKKRRTRKEDGGRESKQTCGWKEVEHTLMRERERERKRMRAGQRGGKRRQKGEKEENWRRRRWDHATIMYAARY